MTLEDALTAACEQLALAPYYRDCVRPLLRDPEGHWPRCCSAGCDPCALTLAIVAARALELMGTPRQAPLPE